MSAFDPKRTLPNSTIHRRALALTSALVRIEWHIWNRKWGYRMPAYIVVEHIITDAAKFEEYRTKVGPMMAKYGARYLTQGGSHKMPEGGHWTPERVAVIEFPDMNSLNTWYNSSEYQPLKALRKESTSDQDMMFFLEGAVTA
jgi:uncharacterized protein (DUF1330 family)